MNLQTVIPRHKQMSKNRKPTKICAKKPPGDLPGGFFIFLFRKYHSVVIKFFAACYLEFFKKVGSGEFFLFLA